jgi:ribosomal protein S28E/S33
MIQPDPNIEILRRLGIPDTGDIHRVSINLMAGRLPSVVIERWVTSPPGETEAVRGTLVFQPDS